MTPAISLPGGTVKPELFGQEAPGVELVVPNDGNDLLTVPCRRLVGALTRRLRPKFAIARRADATTVSEVADVTWSDLVSMYRKISQTRTSGASRTAVHVRGLHEDEPAVLVDGRPAPASIVDIAVAAVIFADQLREGEKGLVIVHPKAMNSEEAALWASLTQLCQDRLGIERGILDFVPAAGIERKVYAVA